MAWSTSQDGFAKARIKAISSLLVAHIGDLQSSFANDPNLAFITNTYRALDATSVVRGDYESVWDINVGGYLRIFVSSGGHRQGIDLTEKDFFLDRTNPNGRQRHWACGATAVFHEKTFSLVSQDLVTTAREDAYMTILDWITFDVLGKDNVIKLPVTSNCYDNIDGHDFLYDTKIAHSGKVFATGGPANSVTLLGIQTYITGFS